MYAVNYSRITENLCLFGMFLTFYFYYSVGAEDSLAPYEYVPSTTERSQLRSKCVNNTTSCSYQISLPGISQESCSLIRYRNTSTDCHLNSFKGDFDAENKFGTVLLFPFVLFDTYAYISFNTTFTHINWKRARFRYCKTGSDVPSICREFQLSLEVTTLNLFDETLYYDCLWTHETITRKIYHFNYVLYPHSDDPPVGHEYVFFVPSDLYLGAKCDPCPSFRKERLDTSTLELFLYVDVSLRPTLKLFVQTAHEMYNITRYRVQLIRKLVSDEWPVITKVISVLPNQTYFTYIHEAKSKPGLYYFNVTPLDSSCHKGECRVSNTPEIEIVNSTQTELLIGVVAAVILIPVLIAVYFMWKKKLGPIEENPMELPKVLLLYNHNYPRQVSDMIRFYEYLRKCNVRALLDLFCIPASVSKNSINWYSDAFGEADYILIFAPPSGDESNEPHPMVIYRNLDKIASDQLNLLLYREEITFEKSFSNIFTKYLCRSFISYKYFFSVGGKQIFIVCLPKCDLNKLYTNSNYKSLTRECNKFMLPKEINKLMKAIKAPITNDICDLSAVFIEPDESLHCCQEVLVVAENSVSSENRFKNENEINLRREELSDGSERSEDEDSDEKRRLFLEKFNLFDHAEVTSNPNDPIL